MEKYLVLATFVGSVIALLFALFTGKRVLRFEEGTPLMSKISRSIREGANAYLRRQYTVVGIFFACMIVVLCIMAACHLLTWFVPFAFLTGGFFGDVVSVIGGWFGRDWSIVPHLGTIHIGSIAIDLPLNLLEGNNPLYVLIAAICLGAIHLALGTGIGIYLKLKDGEWADALLNDLCWWVMIAGILVMATGGTKIVLFVGIGMLVLGQLITGKGFGKITGIFGAVYNGATGYLGDLLSYSRLMALMLAGSVIASVFNQLGSLGNANGMTVGGTILFVLVFCIGHALNFALNLIGCFVHTLRLQFLEFFGKWYRDGGKAFRPLKIQTKYVDIKEE